MSNSRSAHESSESISRLAQSSTVWIGLSFAIAVISVALQLLLLRDLPSTAGQVLPGFLAVGCAAAIVGYVCAGSSLARRLAILALSGSFFLVLWWSGLTLTSVPDFYYDPGFACTYYHSRLVQRLKSDHIELDGRTSTSIQGLVEKYLLEDWVKTGRRVVQLPSCTLEEVPARSRLPAGLLCQKHGTLFAFDGRLIAVGAKRPTTTTSAH